MEPLYGRTMEMVQMWAPRGLEAATLGVSVITEHPIAIFLPLAIRQPNLVACMISARSIQYANLVEDLGRERKS